MITRTKFVIAILLIIFSIKASGQEMLGLGFSNYSGISGKNINPAFLTGSKVYLDVNIIGGGLSIENNFGYIPHDSNNIWTILRTMELKKLNDTSYKYNNFYLYHGNKSYYSLAGTGTVMGPGIMLQDGKHAFGISLSFRNYGSTYHAPGQFLRDLYNQGPGNSDINKERNISNYGAAELSWQELSFNYAYDFYERYGTKLTAGIEFKVLFGVAGFSNDMSTLKYHWINNDSIIVDTLSTRMGIAAPVNFSNNKTDLNPWAKGHGIGLSIGFLYTKNASNVSQKGEKPLCAKPYEDYKYRIGLSIMDIGSIRFKNNTRVYQINTSNALLGINNLTYYSNSIDATMNSIMNQLNVDTTTAVVDSTIRMSLPTAISLQMDYHLRKNIYISGLWINPLHFKTRSLRRPAQLAVIPRYDTRILGVSLPVSWYDYQKLRLGVALRFYSVTIGTEKLGTWLGVGNLEGMDFYFNIKFNLKKGTCLSWKRGACPN